MQRRDVTNQIQRLDAFEERLNVRFEALSGYEYKESYGDEHSVKVCGELHAINGTSIANDIIIQLSVHDKEGRVIAIANESVDAENFFGFHTFEIECNVPPKSAAKLRVLPKRN